MSLSLSVPLISLYVPSFRHLSSTSYSLPHLLQICLSSTHWSPPLSLPLGSLFFSLMTPKCLFSFMSLWLSRALRRYSLSLPPYYFLSMRGFTKPPHLLYSLPLPLPTAPFADCWLSRRPSSCYTHFSFDNCLPSAIKAAWAFQPPFLLTLPIMCWGLSFC
jgi:hypothetical protein